jgi:hypothetical protein
MKVYCKTCSGFVDLQGFTYGTTGTNFLLELVFKMLCETCDGTFVDTGKKEGGLLSGLGCLTGTLSSS